MSAHRVTVVIGTRPEAIKLAPVARALAERRADLQLLLTGQHPLEPEEYGLDPFACVQLACAAGASPHAHVGAVTRAAVPAILASDLVVVQGDTSSALGGALAAAAAGIPLAHVEAGLRTHDRLAPWPEEEFRIAIDAHSDLLFAPTELSAANLRREGVRGEIHVTGNTAVDSVLSAAAIPVRRSQGGKARVLVTCHRRESWGEALDGIAAALREIAAIGRAEILVVLHPNPGVQSRMLRLLEGQEGISLRPPCTHSEMLRLMRQSDLVLSDSGGMQEEAPVLGVPLLVLRERTERPEAIAAGNIALIGRDPGRILSAVARLLDDPRSLAAMRRRSMPYGDGRASDRIADIVAAWLGIDFPYSARLPRPAVL